MASSFTVNLEDLTRILANIKVAEQNAGNQDLTAGAVNVAGQALVDIIGQDAALLPIGLRTVSGVFNHLLPGQQNVGAADQPFPRLLPQELRTGVAAGVDFNGDGIPDFFGAPQNAGAVYSPTGTVVDSQPRTISNLIVDQSINNPAAVEAWFSNPLTANTFALAHPGFTPIRPGQVAGPGELAISNLDLAMIPNQSPDIGLSPQFNGFMTFFGQFFDHGLDLVPKGGNGNVYIPLMPDDPLYVPGSPTNFMVISRLQPNAINITTPFVDQNQTYTSHASHQVFLREYALDAAGHPIATGHLLSGANGGLPTWAEVKAQAADLLGIQLVDADILRVPLLATDEYGRFIRGANGFVQIVTATGLVEANPADNSGAGTLLPANVVPAGTAFLDDIAHDAAPKSSSGVLLTADADNLVGQSLDGQAAGTYDDELLNQHFITGDGRGNENIGLTTIHTVFHNEHDRLVEANKDTIFASGNVAVINEWLQTGPGHQIDAAGLAAINAIADPLLKAAAIDALDWNGERLFQAARFVTEMQYQHLVFEEFARKVQPNVDAFVFTNSADLNPAIVAEFAHTVYRFGHSMLTDTVDRLDSNLHVVGDANPLAPGAQQMGLIEAFLNPVAFSTNNTGSTGAQTAADIAALGVDAGIAGGAILRGMTRQAGNEIDEFVVNALRNNLVGLPLDLASINMARGRDAGIPTLNHAREELYAMTSDAQLKPYVNWFDFAQNIKHPESIINFIAAYGTHTLITGETTLEGKRAAAMAIIFGTPQPVPANGAMVPPVLAHTIQPPADALAFLTATGAYAPDGAGANDDSRGGLNNVDLWIGGLAEEKMQFGGMLGSTFGAVFEYQMEHLQNGDRFYYLSRTQGMNLINQLEPVTFADLVMRNTDLGDVHSTHISGVAFDTPDLILELDRDSVGVAHTAQDNVGLGALDPTWDTSTIAGRLQQIIDPKVVRVLAGVNAATGASVDVNGDGLINGDDNLLKFSGGEHLVLGGTEGRDFLYGDKGIDTLWGDGGDDYLNPGSESDQVFGGEGDDIIEDPFGDDFLRGNQGNDVISNGHGLDFVFGDQGNDFLTAATDATEFFGGEGNDFILGGTAADTIGGNEGDDWIEGGEGFDGIAGENSELFFNSPIVGHDVLDGQGNDTDYDGENGDDIMVQSSGIQRNNGMQGFDWAIHDGDKVAANTDMSIGIGQPVTPAFILRDRFDSVEGLSGYNLNDTLSGSSRLLVAGGGFDSKLDQAGVDRIHGLNYIIGAAGDLNPLTPGNAPNAVILTSDRAFAGGEIILGGAGSDAIRGNLGNDILDGDAWLNVRIAVHSTVVNPVTGLYTGLDHNGNPDAVLFSVESLNEIKARMLSTGADHINPGQLEIVREILNSDGTKVSDTLGSTNRAGDVDIAVYSDVQANYQIEGAGLAPGVVGADVNGDGFITVTHITAAAGGGARTSDGTDNIRNFEILQFSDSVAFLDTTITNRLATGQLLIIDPTPAIAQIGDVLTVNIGTVADADNPGGVVALSSVSVTWQFEQTLGLGDWTNIIDPVSGNAVTGTTFTPTVAFALDGLRLRVAGTFTGANHVPEHVFSAPTASLVFIDTPPVASNGLVTGLEDSVITGAASAVDPQGSPLTFALVGPTTAHGVLNFALDGTFVYTPNANYNGTDSFTFTANDGAFDSNLATVNFNVTPVNDAPTGAPTAVLAAGTEDTAYIVSAASLLAGFSDIDGDPLSVVNLTSSNGTVTNNGTTFTIQPLLNSNGPVTLTYTVTDGLGGNLPGQTQGFTLAPVNDAPVAGPVPLGQIPFGATAGFLISQAALLGTSSDVDGDPLTATNLVLLNPADGTLTSNGNGSWSFVSTGSAPGTVQFGFNVTDGIATISTSTTLDVINLPPTGLDLAPATMVVDENVQGAILASVTVTDPNTTDTHTFTINDNRFEIIDNSPAPGQQLAIKLKDGVSLDFETASTVNLVVRAFDAAGAGSINNPYSFTVNVNNVNEVATQIALTGSAVAEDSNTTTLVGLLSANDPDTGNTLTYQLLNNAGGRFSLNGNRIEVANGVALDFEQATSHTIQVQVSDGIGAPLVQNLTINVTDVNPENVTGTAAGEMIVGGGLGDFIDGAGGDDILIGGAGADNMAGGAGNDRFYATVNDGNDVYNGGTGTNTYDLSQTTAASNVNLTAGTATSAHTGSDTLVNIQNVVGSQGANVITGNVGNNAINGLGGNDTILGVGGADLLNGGGGNDNINGGLGNDRIDGGLGNDVLNGGANNDTINVSLGNDRIVLNANFGNDVINGFDASVGGGVQDHIDVSGLGITAANFAAHVTITDLGADTLVTIAGDGTLRLIGVNGVGANAITQADFQF